MGSGEVEERFQLLVASISRYHFVLLDAQGLITSWNSGPEWTLGQAGEDYLGQPYARLFTEEDVAAGQPGQILRQAQAQGRYEGQGWQVRSDGRRYFAHLVVTAFHDAHGTLRGFATMTRDLSGRAVAQAALESLTEALEGELKAKNQALVQAQKMESLGVLTGGIAHDFNNLLGAMQGHVELAMGETSLAGARPYLVTVMGTLAKAAGLVRQMLAYAGKGGLEARSLDLNQLVEELLQLLELSLAKKAEIRQDLWPAPLPVLADPIQIQQVVMNLVINASEAMAGRHGLIALRTRLEERPQGASGGLFLGQPPAGGPCVALEVADDGSGMTQEVLERIFDPFFTTKCSGRGLGLAAVQGIIRAHQGCLQVQSQPGQGTTFKVLLPAATAPAVAEAPATPAPPPGPQEVGARGTVLVVDDEDELRAAMLKALARAGFPTLEGRDGEEALAVFQAHQDRIRLIIMDLTMPRLSGEEACRELRRRGAAVPILLTCGYDEAQAVARFAGVGLAGFLQKPFGLAKLVELVRNHC